MKRIIPSLKSTGVTAFAVIIISCSPPEPNTGAAPTAPPAAESTESGVLSAEEREKIKAELAKLPPEDAAAAEKQRICPVSEELLGTMGIPKKVDVQGRPVWICCEGCRDRLLADPDKYLARLPANAEAKPDAAP